MAKNHHVGGDRCLAPWAPFQLHTWENGACVHCKAKQQVSKNRNAVALGRKGGAATSAAKAKAARQNGKKGGRPRKKPKEAR